MLRRKKKKKIIDCSFFCIFEMFHYNKNVGDQGKKHLELKISPVSGSFENQQFFECPN